MEIRHQITVHLKWDPIAKLLILKTADGDDVSTFTIKEFFAQLGITQQDATEAFNPTVPTYPACTRGYRPMLPDEIVGPEDRYLYGILSPTLDRPIQTSIGQPAKNWKPSPTTLLPSWWRKVEIPEPEKPTKPSTATKTQRIKARCWVTAAPDSIVGATSHVWVNYSQSQVETPASYNIGTPVAGAPPNRWFAIDPSIHLTLPATGRPINVMALLPATIIQVGDFMVRGKKLVAVPSNRLATNVSPSQTRKFWRRFPGN